MKEFKKKCYSCFNFGLFLSVCLALEEKIEFFKNDKGLVCSACFKTIKEKIDMIKENKKIYFNM